MVNIEDIKSDVKVTLENNFINNPKTIRREMDLLNLLITSFEENGYTYDEYCRCRMQFELEACDELVNFEFENKNELTSEEKHTIQVNASLKYNVNKDLDPQELLKEEWVKFNAKKSASRDKEIFYPIFKYSNIAMLKNKIKGEAWESRVDYFEDICELKAKQLSDFIYQNNIEIHEENIRNQNI